MTEQVHTWTGQAFGQIAPFTRCFNNSDDRRLKILHYLHVHGAMRLLLPAF